MSKQMTWGRLKTSHPKLNLSRVRVLNALYQGGASLLDDNDIMSIVFPRHANEGDTSFLTRRRFAFYDNVFSQAVNNIVAGLAQDPCVFVAKRDEGKEQEIVKLDDYWMSLMSDCTPPHDDSPAITFDQRMRAMGCQAMVTGLGWMLCDMLPMGDATSEAEQIKDGSLQAYPISYNAENVIDWEEEKGTFLWVRSYSCSQPASAPETPRNYFRHEWIVWEQDTYTKYELVIDRNNKDQNEKIWKDEDIVLPLETIGHSFKSVPWVLFDASPAGEPSLHVGDLLDSLARSLFVQQNAEAFLRMRAHAQQLYEFLAPEMASIDTEIGANQKDENRAKPGRRRSPDTVEVRGGDDRAEFIAPSMNGVEATQKAISDLREAMLRVTGQLALSQDTSGAMLRRSGDSKAQDKVAEEVALGAFGKKLLACARRVAEMLAIGRGDEYDDVPEIQGYTNFSVSDDEGELNKAVLLENISIPSVTFQREKAIRIARTYLGDDCPPETLVAIRDELKETITAEQYTPAMQLAKAGFMADDGTDSEDPPADKKPFGGKPGKKSPADPKAKKPGKPKE